MKLAILKILSTFSALLVFFPTRSRVLIPFGLMLGGYEKYTGWDDILITTLVWASLVYCIYSAAKELKSKTDSVITLIPLVAFWIFSATHAIDFINYANWLSLTTGILSAIIISITIVKLIKRLTLSPKNVGA